MDSFIQCILVHSPSERRAREPPEDPSGSPQRQRPHQTRVLRASGGFPTATVTARRAAGGIRTASLCEKLGISLSHPSAYTAPVASKVLQATTAPAPPPHRRYPHIYASPQASGTPHVQPSDRGSNSAHSRAPGYCPPRDWGSSLA
ncbi:hypothetical protein CALCODRAFT_9743 [Calocera cornea HHB12733]|uniref:Uncharacterized protein n=1 Tax=Calocera cornea HHB12733 TaxID=1353952 RepID=A0A165J607_9BASI|nr:hypothetical protein CALCODRAFT_9743 [Calocera cornea HHB12733]